MLVILSNNLTASYYTRDALFRQVIYTEHRHICKESTVIHLFFPQNRTIHESLATFTLRQRTHDMNTVGCHNNYTHNTIQKQMVSTWLQIKFKKFANNEPLKQEQLTEHKLKTRKCNVPMPLHTQTITNIQFFSDMTM